MEDNATMTTTSTEQGETSVNETTEAIPQAESAQSEAPASGNAEAAAESPFLEIKYNKELKGLTKEQAAVYAQKGMKYEQKYEKEEKMLDTYKSAYESLERIAALSGKSIDEFVKGYEGKIDEDYKNKLVERFGEDEDTINEMMRLYSIDKQNRLDTAMKNKEAAKEQEEKRLNQRLADEFAEMQEDFPELTEFSALPDGVKQAAFGGMPLPYAYLLFKHKETKKAEAAQKAQAEAAKKTTGSMNAAETEEGTEAGRRYLKALWGR